MKISKVVEREMKNPEFKTLYLSEKERSASALALYHAREAAGLTQADLAERAGVPQATIA